MSPPLASWMVVAAALIVAETLVVYLLRGVAPEISMEAVYLVVSSVRELALGVVNAVLNAAAVGVSYVSYVPPSVDFVASGPVRGRVVVSAGVFACGARSRGGGELR